MSVRISSVQEVQNDRSVCKSEKNLPLGLIISIAERAMLSNIIINMQGFFQSTTINWKFYPLTM